MTDHERLSEIEFLGVQVFDVCDLALFNDPVTNSTFCVLPGETVGSALARLKQRFGEPLHA